MHRHLFSEDNSNLVHVVVGCHYEETVSFTENCIRTRNGDLPVMEYSGNHEFLSGTHFAYHFLEGLAENGRIPDFAVHAPCRIGDRFFFGKLCLFLFEVNSEDCLENDYEEKHAEHTERICHGISRCKA